jgi:pimeloyl-ACP methyl ester carboxylesterase
LIPALANSFHVVAPDYPGFGNSDIPDPAEFAYTFDRLAEITARLLKQKGFDRYGLFVQDYGGPVGFRIVTRNPDALEWLIIQNTNAYEEGFTEAWAGLRNLLWKDRTPASEEGVVGLLEFDAIKAIYLHGHKYPDLISPDNWNMDFRFMERPNARRVQMDLFYDYRTNVALYPKWQTFLRDVQPKTLIFWGQDDIFFTREGGEAYLRDLPKAEMHRLDSGHFAVEDCLEQIATNIERFYDEKVEPDAHRRLSRRAG